MKEINRLTDQAYQLFEAKKFNEALDKILKAEDEIKNLGSESISEAEFKSMKSSLLNFKGFNYLAINKIEIAKQCFEESLVINPNSSQGCAGLGEVFYLANMDTESKIMFEWAIDFNPLNQFAISGLAKVNKNMLLPPNHNTLNLETTLKKGHKFYRILGAAYQLFNENRFEDALVKIDEAESLFKPNLKSNEEINKIATLENFKGFNFLALNKVDEAKECFERSLNFNPDSSQACAGLGEVLFLQGADDRAKTMFEWGLKNNPSNEFARQGLTKVNKNLKLEPTHNSLDNEK